MREMTELFRVHGTATWEKLRAAITAADFDEARRQAHTLKGSAANLAANPLRHAAAAAETFAREGNAAALRAAIPTLEREMDRCLKAIAESHRK